MQRPRRRITQFGHEPPEDRYLWPHDYYVYAWRDGAKPRYVGFGHGCRAWRHIRIAKRWIETGYRDPEMQRVHFNMAQHIREGGEFQLHILAENQTSLDARDLEWRRIAEIGRLCDGGPLWNVTEGGDSNYHDWLDARAEAQADHDRRIAVRVRDNQWRPYTGKV